MESKEKNKGTMLFSLSCGDRFYFISDSKKMVWQVSVIEKKTINNEVLNVTIKKGNDIRPIKKNKKVVFLRNVSNYER